MGLRRGAISISINKVKGILLLTEEAYGEILLHLILLLCEFSSPPWRFYTPISFLTSQHVYAYGVQASRSDQHPERKEIITTK